MMGGGQLLPVCVTAGKYRLLGCGLSLPTFHREQLMPRQHLRYRKVSRNTAWWHPATCRLKSQVPWQLHFLFNSHWPGLPPWLLPCPPCLPPSFQVDWLTPVEVFAPWYGRALAHYMLELRKHDLSIDSTTPLSIVEIGGGTGTLAASILVSGAAGAGAAGDAARSLNACWACACRNCRSKTVGYLQLWG